ncbi:MAG: hypothetical protein HZA36_00445, partial [Parcubacteria group bacterium]|nr:hypothetical protein [Parcubacteria group bacterium]
MFTLFSFSCDTVLRILFGITFFVVSLFVTSFDSFWFIFDKWLLFYGLTLCILIVWMIRGLRDGVLELRWSLFDILMLVFLWCVAVSTYTSVDVWRSILGYFTNPSGGFLSIATCGIFYIVFRASIKRREDFRFYFRIVCASLCILVAIEFFVLAMGWNVSFLKGDLVHLSYSSSRAIIAQGLHERRWTGFGPDTFSYSSGRFRVPQMNSESTWNKVVEHPYTLWLDVINDLGILGFFVFLFSFLYFIIVLFRGLRRVSQEEYFLEYLGLCFLIAVWCIYSFFFSMSGGVIFIGFFYTLLAYSFCVYADTTSRCVRIPFIITFRHRYFVSLFSLSTCVVV